MSFHGVSRGLQRVIEGITWGTILGLIKGDTRSLHCGSHGHNGNMEPTSYGYRGYIGVA